MELDSVNETDECGGDSTLWSYEMRMSTIGQVSHGITASSWLLEEVRRGAAESDAALTD
jgi:hypothetical protein